MTEEEIDVEAIAEGMVAWTKGKPYHTVLTIPPTRHHVFRDCEEGVKIEIRHLRKGRAHRTLCEVCAGRQATT